MSDANGSSDSKRVRWGIVRQFANHRCVLTTGGGWARDDSSVEPMRFATRKSAEAYLQRHVGTHFHEFVSRLKDPSHV